MFTKYLPRFGYTTYVVSRSGFPKDFEGRTIHRVPNAQGVHWTVALASTAGQLVDRVLPHSDQLAWVPYAIDEGVRIIKGSNVHAVISTSPPVGVHLAGLTIAKRSGLPWVADFRDPLVDNPFRRKSIGKLYETFVERHIMRTAQAVVVNTKALGDLWRQRYPQWKDKIQILHNGYDAEECFPLTPTVTGLTKVLAHVGTIYGGRHPAQLLSSLGRLMSNGEHDAIPKVVVKLIGPIQIGDWRNFCPFDRFVKQKILIFNNESIPKDQARAVMAAADFLLLLDINDTNTALQVPGKLFDYVRVGRPILAITVRNSPTVEILSKSGVRHVCIYATDPPAVTDEKLSRFLQLPITPVCPSSWFLTQFSALTQVRALASILDRVCS